jgi:hypothetical protein
VDESVSKRWQFSLRVSLLFITAAAIGVALGANFPRLAIAIWGIVAAAVLIHLADGAIGHSAKQRSSHFWPVVTAAIWVAASAMFCGLSAIVFSNEVLKEPWQEWQRIVWMSFAAMALFCLLRGWQSCNRLKKRE